MATTTAEHNFQHFTPILGWPHRQPSLFSIMTLVRQNNLLNLHERCEANKKLAPASYSTPIGATFRIAPHRVAIYIFSKSCKLSLSKSRLTPDLARQRNSYTPQLRSNNCHQYNKLSTNCHQLSDHKTGISATPFLLNSVATIAIRASLHSCYNKKTSNHLGCSLSK